jgi:hypothetical protein
MKVTWDLDGLDLAVHVSNIQWDNDSVGVTEAWGFNKGHDCEEYISDFNVDEIEFAKDPDQTIYNADCHNVGTHNWHDDPDFLDKLEHLDRYTDHG